MGQNSGPPNYLEMCWRVHATSEDKSDRPPMSALRPDKDPPWVSHSPRVHL